MTCGTDWPAATWMNTGGAPRSALSPWQSSARPLHGNGRAPRQNVALLGAKGHAVGLDFASNMLTVAAQKTQPLQQSTPASVGYLLGDAAALPFRSATFDCLTNGFAMRNMPLAADLVLHEMWRVLRPADDSLSLTSVDRNQRCWLDCTTGICGGSYLSRPDYSTTVGSHFNI